jgi:hypothetical protein
MTITVKPRTVVVLLFTTLGVILVAHVLTLVSTYGFGHDTLRGLVRLFNLDEEHNIPTYYSSVVLLICSGLALALAAADRKSGGRDRRYWGGMSGLLLLASVDEFAQLHEYVNGIIRGPSGADRPFYDSWVLPYAVIILVVGILYIRFVLRLPADSRRWVILAGAMYVGGSLGFELIGGLYLQSHGWNMGLAYDLITTAEEALEMGAGTVLFYALALHGEKYADNLGVRIGSR